MEFGNPLKKFQDKYRQFAFEYWCFGAGPFKNALADRKDAWNLRHGHKMKLTGNMAIVESVEEMMKLFDEQFPEIPKDVTEYDVCVWGSEMGTFEQMEKKMMETHGEHIGRATMKLLKDRMEQTKLNLIIQSIDTLMAVANVEDKRESNGIPNPVTHCPKCGANVERE